MDGWLGGWVCKLNRGARVIVMHRRFKMAAAGSSAIWRLYRSLRSAFACATRHPLALTPLQATNTALAAEKERMDVLLARQYNLIRCGGPGGMCSNLAAQLRAATELGIIPGTRAPQRQHGAAPDGRGFQASRWLGGCWRSLLTHRARARTPALVSPSCVLESGAISGGGVGRSLQEKTLGEKAGGQGAAGAVGPWRIRASPRRLPGAARLWQLPRVAHPPLFHVPALTHSQPQHRGTWRQLVHPPAAATPLATTS